MVDCKLDFEGNCFTHKGKAGKQFYHVYVEATGCEGGYTYIIEAESEEDALNRYLTDHIAVECSVDMTDGEAPVIVAVDGSYTPEREVINLQAKLDRIIPVYQVSVEHEAAQYHKGFKNGTKNSCGCEICEAVETALKLEKEQA